MIRLRHEVRATSPLLREAGRGRGPTRQRWEGEGHPCHLFPSNAAFTADASTLNQETGCPSPSHCFAMGPSLSPLSRGEVYAASIRP
jgi:hypothetical protein